LDDDQIRSQADDGSVVKKNPEKGDPVEVVYKSVVFELVGCEWEFQVGREGKFEEFEVEERKDKEEVGSFLVGAVMITFGEVFVEEEDLDGPEGK
jgi:hypothetical protein